MALVSYACHRICLACTWREIRRMLADQVRRSSSMVSSHDPALRSMSYDTDLSGEALLVARRLTDDEAPTGRIGVVCQSLACSNVPGDGRPCAGQGQWQHERLQLPRPAVRRAAGGWQPTDGRRRTVGRDRRTASTVGDELVGGGAMAAGPDSATRFCRGPRARLSCGTRMAAR